MCSKVSETGKGSSRHSEEEQRFRASRKEKDRLAERKSWGGGPPN